MRFKSLIPLIAILYAVSGTVFYGKCHHFESPEIPDETLKSFEGDRGNVDFFSNVRFERLFEHPPIQEKYVSNHVIQLRYTNEPGQDCFYPFQLVRKSANASTSSTRTESVTQINTRVIEIRNNDHLVAFSCFEDTGNRHLEFFWVIRRREAWMMSLSSAQEAFGELLDTTKTTRKGLMKTHYQLPFCKGKFWPTVIYCLAGVIAVAAVIGAVMIYWKYSRTSMPEKESSSSVEQGEGHLKDSAFERTAM